MIQTKNARPAILVTGAAGYMGTVFLQEFQQSAHMRAQKPVQIVALDLKAMPLEQRQPGIIYLQEDVRSEKLAEIFKRHCVQIVVHLAAIVTPGKKSNRELEYAIDVLGTENVLIACVAAGVKKIIVASSGAAYGYHRDNPKWITEAQPLRGNYGFAYSHHKKLVEELLARYRHEHPQLQQVIFRIGTILGESTNNQITALFDQPRLLAIKGADSPFVFIWDRDVARCFVQAIFSEQTGVYNLAGEGALALREIADILGKKLFVLPASMLRVALRVLKTLRLSVYGPEQIDFLRYRPVLDNTKLKIEFGYVPQKTSREVFEFFVAARQGQNMPV
ncbi:MAG: SDR family oxidoreductase [candidate division KSB1 bacterium]